jgi:hypothetical protein
MPLWLLRVCVRPLCDVCRQPGATLAALELGGKMDSSGMHGEPLSLRDVQ